MKGWGLLIRNSEKHFKRANLEKRYITTLAIIYRFLKFVYSAFGCKMLYLYIGKPPLSWSLVLRGSRWAFWAPIDIRL